MQEKALRKIHRYLGVMFGFFFFLQGGSGLLIAVGELLKPPGKATAFAALADEEHEHYLVQEGGADGGNPGDEHGISGLIHHHDAKLLHGYRVVVGSGLMAQLFTGILISQMIRRRQNETAKR